MHLGDPGCPGWKQGWEADCCVYLAHKLLGSKGSGFSWALAFVLPDECLCYRGSWDTRYQLDLGKAGEQGQPHRQSNKSQ